MRTLVTAAAAALLSAAILTAAPQTVLAKDEYCPYLVKYNTTVHSGPGTTYEVVGSLTAGEVVDALVRARNGYNLLGRGGWASNAALELVNEPHRCNG